MTAAAAVCFMSQSILLFILLIAGRKRFSDETARIKIPGAKIFAVPAMLYLLALTGHKYNTYYEKKLSIMLGELYGIKSTAMGIRVFIAAKLSYLWLSILGFTAMAVLVDIDAAYIFFGVLVCITIFLAPDWQLKSRLQKKTRELLREFPEFINKLVLLIDAGLTVRSAIQKIVENSTKDRILIIELTQALNEISSGKTEIKAYEDFARRCRLQDITAFSSALMQNMKKGNEELVPILKLQSVTCWQNRRNAARKMGEEASSKLLIPLIITFVALMIMLMAPALMQMKI